jgi:hypothetical protein
VVRYGATLSDNEFPFARRNLETSMMCARRTYELTSMLSTAAILCSSETFGVSLSELLRSTSRDSGRLAMRRWLWRYESLVFLEIAWIFDHDVAMSSSSLG